MKLTIPCRKTSNTIFDGRCRPKADVTLEIGDVGVGCLDIAGLHRQHFLYGGPTEFLLKQRYDMDQIFRMAVADVVDFPRRGAGRRVGLRTIPVGSALRRGVDEANDRLADVIDIGEIPPHPAMVEEPDRL